jgi:hypothetical protein
MEEQKGPKKFSVMLHLEVVTDGHLTINNLNLITRLVRQTILQETNNTVEILYSSCEVLGIDGE